MKEIWFKKILWGYIPSNWKGWASIFALLLLFGIMYAVVSLLIHLSHRNDLDFLPFFSAFPVVIVGWIIAARHS